MKQLFIITTFITTTWLLASCDQTENSLPASEAQTAMNEIIQTNYGQLRGIRANNSNSVDAGDSKNSEQNIRVFKGVPYAKPPIGELRWRPPESPASWTGVRDADQFSQSCIQPTNTSTFVWARGDFDVSEDCLYLNIWSDTEAKKQPVMVWFHGGAHTSGQGHSEVFDGTRLSQQGVVLVSINYRIGALGFLAHPWLAQESERASSGNYGLLDKIAALKWVKENIEQFGGDAENVTIFGQSAGSQSVCSLMTSPLAKGLFHKAIGQSASCVGPAPKRDVNGQQRGEKLANELKATNLSELRASSPEQILKASNASGWANASRIVIDGWVLPEPQIDAFRAGRQAQVPLLLGSLADEGNQLFPVNEALTENQLNQYLTNLVGEEAKALAAEYVEEFKSSGKIQHAVATDVFMAFGMRRWAEYSDIAGNDTWLYFMDHVPPAFHLYWPENPGIELKDGPRSGGAYHSGDLTYVFGNTRRVGLDWREDDHKLSQTMVEYWTNFAHTGNPNGGQLPPWQKFDRETMNTQMLNTSPQNVEGVRKNKIDILSKAQPLFDEVPK